MLQSSILRILQLASVAGIGLGALQDTPITAAITSTVSALCLAYLTHKLKQQKRHYPKEGSDAFAIATSSGAPIMLMSKKKALSLFEDLNRINTLKKKEVSRNKDGSDPFTVFIFDSPVFIHHDSCESRTFVPPGTLFGEAKFILIPKED